MSTNHNEDQSTSISRGMQTVFPPDWSDLGALDVPLDSDVINESWLSQIDLSELDLFNVTWGHDSWQQICQFNDYAPKHEACKDIRPSDLTSIGDRNIMSSWGRYVEYPMSQATCSSDTGVSDVLVEGTSPSGLLTMTASPSPLTNWEYLRPVPLRDPSSCMPLSSERSPSAYDTSLLLPSFTPIVTASPRAVPIPPAKGQTRGGQSTGRKGRKRVKELSRDRRKREKPAECPYCGKRFQYLRERHLRTHDPNRAKFQCHICGEEFTEAFNRDRHVRNTHQQNTSRA